MYYKSTLGRLLFTAQVKDKLLKLSGIRHYMEKKCSIYEEFKTL